VEGAVKAHRRMMDDPPSAAIDAGFLRVATDGGQLEVTRGVAVEMPVAVELNGFNHAVLMASPVELVDLVTGFLFTERLIGSASEILEVEEVAVGGGRLLRLTLAEDRRDELIRRVRHRTADSACGLCGVESLEQALRPLPPVTSVSHADADAVFRALAALPAEQELNRRTGAVHAAALCAADGTVRLVREDVGRHNAFDKLIGAMLREGLGWDGGFALLTSRCSYELVEKAVLAGCPLLATVSAPTSLAVARAAAAGLPLRTLVRADALLQPIDA
jgi:FdhD protein